MTLPFLLQHLYTQYFFTSVANHTIQLLQSGICVIARTMFLTTGSEMLLAMICLPAHDYLRHSMRYFLLLGMDNWAIEDRRRGQNNCFATSIE